MKNVRLAGLALSCLLLNGCFMAETQRTHSSAPKGTTPLIFSNNKPAIEETYLVVNQAYYLLPDICQQTRLHGDQADQRLLGDQADQRMLGDQADSRLHGDQADQRMLGDQADSRLHGDQADQRMLGDQADSRLHGSQVSQFKCSKIASINGVVVSGFTGSEQVVINKGSQFGSYSWANNALILKF